MNDAIRKANQLKKNLTEPDENTVELAPGESTIIYHFRDIFSQGIEKSYRWIAFCVNATRFRKGFHKKWHLIPVDANMRSTYFGEHDGVNDTMVGILEAKVHSSDGGSIVVSIAHAPVPPFRIENRSNTHCVQFVQDDEDAVVFELPPMHSCGYTWDSPLGKKRLRAVVVPKVQMKNHHLVETLDSDCYEGKTLADANDSDESVDSALEDVESIESKVANEPLLHSLKSGMHPQNEKDTASCSKSIGSSIFMKKCISSVEASDWSRRRRLFGRYSRSYKMLKVGRTKKLPCPAAHAQIYGEMNKVKMSSKLYAHIRILAGTKILSFSDSPWLAEQVDQGLLRKGGDFKSALCDINVDGFGFYLMDEFPREMIGVVVRDIQIRKPMGSIETTAKIRHFQIDSMLPNARYPIIIQPLPLGVDRRESSKEATIPGSVNKNECFWLSHDEKPVPIFEVTFSYVPQSNMIWIPNVDVFISPMKVQVDVDYLLRVAGIVVNSIYKYQDGVAENHTAITRANHELQYITRGQMNMCLTYIEKLDIAPVWFEVELNIKPDEAENNAENDAATSESALTLNTIARSTNSGTCYMCVSL